MSVREEFDSWAAEDREKGMEESHWHTARHVLARMPVEEGQTVLDLGTGSGYALRALRKRGVDRGYGLDGSPEMARKAREYSADDANLGFVVGDFDHLPFDDDSVDHVFSMKAGRTITYCILLGGDAHRQQGTKFTVAFDHRIAGIEPLRWEL